MYEYRFPRLCGPDGGVTSPLVRLIIRLWTQCRTAGTKSSGINIYE
jgi:hypothetical protein